MKIALGGDHAGYEYKKEMISLLKSNEAEINDFSAVSSDSLTLFILS